MKADACERVRALVTDHLDGALGPAERRALLAHLAGCGDFTRYLAEIEATIGALADLPPEPVDPATRDRLLALYRSRASA
jgi:anti-sigma factor RsiW